MYVCDEVGLWFDSGGSGYECRSPNSGSLSIISLYRLRNPINLNPSFRISVVKLFEHRLSLKFVIGDVV